MTAGVFEGKYDLDSLLSFLKLSYWYWRYTDDTALLHFASADGFMWLSAVREVVRTIGQMQVDDGMSTSRMAASYLFQRLGVEAQDSLPVQGRGPPSRPFGLSRSLFRPSDDAVTFPYHIPGEAVHDISH
jgi:meiotically up-regulated gene 157 (Mug157) protein